MKRKLKKLFSSSNLKRYISVFLCALILVFGCQLFLPLEAEALALTTGAIVLGAGILAAFGITFATSEAARNMSTSWLNSMGDDLKQKMIYYGAAIGGLVEIEKRCFFNILQSFNITFPHYANLGHQTLNFSAEVHQQIMSTGLHSYLLAGNVLELGELPVGVDVDVTFQTSSSTIMRYVGLETLRNNYTVDQYITQNNNYQYLISSVPALDLVFVNTFSDYSNYTTYPGLNLYTVGDVDSNGNITKHYDTAVSTQFNILQQLPMYFKGEYVNLDSNQYGRYFLTTATYGNIASYLVTSGVLSKESPLINCDDWSWQKGAIDGLLLGKDVFDVGLDIEHAPAIDGFPSQVGDASDVDSYPDTIPLNIPTDITDETIGDLTADKVRDVSSSDVDTDTSPTPPKVDPPTDETKNLKDTFVTSLDNGMPFTDALFDFFRGFEKQAKPLKFDFEFRGKKYSITTDFYTPYRERIRSVLCVFFAVISLLAIWRMWRSLLGQGIGSVAGLSYSGSNYSSSSSTVKKGD